MYHNSKTQIVTKLKNLKTQSMTILKTPQIVTKLKNLNCDKTHDNFQKIPKTQILTKLKISICDKTQQLKLGQNSNSYRTQNTQN